MTIVISKLRKARKGEIPSHYAIEAIQMNDAVVEMRTPEYTEYKPVRLPVYATASRTFFEFEFDTPRRKAMLETVKKLHVKGENRISYGYRATRFARKAVVWLAFWLFVFCVAYTIAGLFNSGLQCFKIW